MEISGRWLLVTIIALATFEAVSLQLNRMLMKWKIL